MSKKTNLLTGVLAVIFIVLNTMYYHVPRWLCIAAGYILAFVQRIDYSVIASNVTVTYTASMATEVLAVLILAFAVYIEAFVILGKTKKKRKWWYWYLSKALIIVYAVVYVVYRLALRYSIGMIIYNWYYWIVLGIVVVIGGILDWCR